MWPLFVSIRYLIAKRREKFISIISLISILGVAVGVAALIVVISVMTGFDEEIKDKIIGTYAHIVVTRDGGTYDVQEARKLISENENVVAVSSFMEKQALLRVGNKIVGVLLRGVDVDNEPYVSNIAHFTGKGTLQLGNGDIVMGSELIKSLGASVGDKVSLISPNTNQALDFTVSDIFNSGRYDYDANIVCVNLNKAKELFKTNNVTGMGVRVKNEYNVPSIKKALQEHLKYPYVVRTWMDIDKNLMKALAMEKKIMFLILGLIVIVACFNISSSLIMMVMEKTKDIGVLRSLGATSSSIGVIFLLEGLFIGFLGTVLGGVFGIAIARNINPLADAIEKATGFEFFPNDIYYLSLIPAKIDIMDVSLIIGFAVILATLSGIYPAFQAARLEPVEAIRYE